MSKEFFKSDIQKFKGLDISYYENVAESDNMIVFMVHGLADHAIRYEKLGRKLRQEGIGSATLDLPGHGNSAYGNEGLGLWPEDGFNFCIDAVNNGIKKLSEKYGKPIILMGHSMGAFLALGFIQKFSDSIKACILSGTNDSQAPVLMSIGKILATVITTIKGSDYKSKILDTMSFGSFNGHFKPNRTKYDWISRDTEEVDKYVADPYCGFIASTGLFKSLLGGLSVIYKEERISAIPKKLPIYCFAGGRDPVGEFGKGPSSLTAKFKNAGIKDIKLKIYDEARHECLNEINNDEVMEDIASFCNYVTKMA